MDPNDDDINEEQEHRDHLIRSAAAITVAAVAVAVALDDIERQPYRGEPLRGLIETERIKEAAQWPNEISYFLLTLLMSKHKDGRTGDNGLRREAWIQIAAEVNARWVTSYDWEQTRNHFRIWKARLRALTYLQKDSGMGWNDVERRFCADHHRWADMKKKEQRYWKDHPVLPIHLETLSWLGNEIATGEDARGISEQIAESNQVNPSTDVPEIDPLLDLDNDEELGYNEVPTPQASYSTRRRGRPCVGSSSSQQNKKKTVVADRLIDPINRLIDAIVSSSAGSNETLFGQRVNEAISEMYEPHEIEKMSDAAIFLMKNKWAANAILSAPKERRVYMMNSMMHPSTSNP